MINIFFFLDFLSWSGLTYTFFTKWHMNHFVYKTFLYLIILWSYQLKKKWHAEDAHYKVFHWDFIKFIVYAGLWSSQCMCVVFLRMHHRRRHDSFFFWSLSLYLWPYFLCCMTGVAGGAASGKTTVCDMIIQQLHDQRVVLVNQVTLSCFIYTFGY